MRTKVIIEIVNNLKEKLSADQCESLKIVLRTVLERYDITESVWSDADDGDKDYEAFMECFFAERENEGLSKETIKNYRMHLHFLFQDINKNVREITDEDINRYLKRYKEKRQVSNGYMNDIRHVFNSFFCWMQIKKHIAMNPMVSIRPFKEVKRIKRPFTGEQMESMRSHCDRERDLALLEVLYSTAIRVGEVVKLNRSDIDFSDTGIIVFGKGNKERETYLNSKAFYHLKEYLKIRTDDNEALFVSSRKPYQRLTKAGIQNIFRNIGKKSGVEKVHPHRFRRTAATDLLRAGMPLEEVKEYLGHEKIDTTMIYCTVNQDNIKNSHQRYMSA